MPRKCRCAGMCNAGPKDVTRREFLSAISLTAASGFVRPTAADTGWQAPATQLSAWQAASLKPGKPRRYRAGVHSDARLPLGGIGTGTVELGSDGRLTTWQLFNTLRDGHVPLYFAVRCDSAGNRSGNTAAGSARGRAAGAPAHTARLLQTVGGPDWPKVKSIEMTGEYPVASLRFMDSALPIELSVTAFSPFSPLDARLSSMPVACFVFHAHNPNAQAVKLSLAAFMQNPVGYDAHGVPESSNSDGSNEVAERLDGVHPNFGGNVNRVSRHSGATALIMEAEPGAITKLDRSVRLFTNLDVDAMAAPFADRPMGLSIESLGRLDPRSVESDASGVRTVIWLEEPSFDLTAALLAKLQEAVTNGAALIFSGASLPLLSVFGNLSGGKPLDTSALRADIVFEDFENGYEKWTVEGNAFGDHPAAGTLPGQQPVSGFEGHGLVNSYLGGDGPTGRLVSREFRIERAFISLLVGGGSHKGTQVRLVVAGKSVRAASGRDEERLAPVLWEVSEFQGKQAHIEIVDQETGGWGHINVDSIRFSDGPVAPAALEILDSLLPARFQAIRPIAPDQVEFVGLTPLPDASSRKLRQLDRIVTTRPLGAGSVTMVDGSALPPGQTDLTGARARGYALVCEVAGTPYALADGGPSDAPGFGALALASLGPSPTVLSAFDSWHDAWHAFALNGRLPEAATGQRTQPTPRGRTVNGAVATTIDVPPGGTVDIPFFLAWRYPNMYSQGRTPIGNHYAREWPTIAAVVDEAASRFAHLHAATDRFRQTFYDSTLPYWMLDCITSQVATIRHAGVVFQTADGTAYGWEGSNGCCDPTCTHVWGYEQTLAHLFPELERSMRAIDFKHQQGPDGGVNNRTEVPSPPHPSGEHPFADGHSSCVLKAYREALNSPNGAFFREYWPHVKHAVEYLIARDAAASGSPVGVLADDQWNTYDEALHGVNTFISGYYLAALRAGEEWARRMGETATAERFRVVFERGRERLISLCWNGEYFEQHLPGYEKMAGEVGPGCMSDQLIGQWWAHQLGLGYILPQEKVLSAMRSIFKYNWKSDLTGWPHAPRAFAGFQDKGLIICTWPRGGRPPSVMNYSDEVWTGIEYQVAAHMIYEGMVSEGMAIAKGARDRYDGVPRAPIPRNPWNEIECGGHYARAMSSWSLLLAASGFEYDGPAGRLRLTPRVRPDNFRGFFSGPEGWGTIRQVRQNRQPIHENEIRIVRGRFSISRLQLQATHPASRALATVGNRPVHAELQRVGSVVEIVFAAPVNLRSGQALLIRLT